VKIGFSCPNVRWELTDDVNLTPPPCGGKATLETSVQDWIKGIVEFRCPYCRSVSFLQEGAFTVIDHGLPLAVCAVIRNEAGEILAVSRRDDHTAFGLPGGKVDPQDGDIDPISLGVTLRRAIARELWEEVGVRIDPEAFEFVFTLPDPTGYWNFALSAPADLCQSAASQADEGVVSWLTWDKLETGPFGFFNKELHSHLER
jgi:8-oxo-dGTP pyrophosphatase MutT (NUDIX family)